MSTLNEDLERMAISLRAITDHEITINDGSVYVNFGWSEAIVLQPELSQYGKLWEVEALAWDRTHGVSAEQWLGLTTENCVPLIVKVFLDARAKEDAELSAILDAMPDDI